MNTQYGQVDTLGTRRLSCVGGVNVLQHAPIWRDNVKANASAKVGRAGVEKKTCVHIKSAVSGCEHVSAVQDHASTKNKVARCRQRCRDQNPNLKRQVPWCRWGPTKDTVGCSNEKRQPHHFYQSHSNTKRLEVSNVLDCFLQCSVYDDLMSCCNG